MADTFIIKTKDADKYITMNSLGYCFTTDKKKAATFKSEEAASNTLRSSLSKDFKKEIKDDKVSFEFIKLNTGSDIVNTIPTVMDVTPKEVTGATTFCELATELQNLDVSSYGKLQTELVDALMTIGKLVNEISKVNEELSECDLQLSDIYHFIENDTKTGYLKQTLLDERALLQDVLRRRRVAKNKIALLSILQKTFDTDVVNTGLKQLVNTVKIVDSKVYTNRTSIMEEL